MMRFPVRDVIATLLVAVGLVIAGALAIGAPVPGFGTVGAVAVAVLVLGVAASVSAVVPGFDELLRGSRLYLVTASALGVLALGAGVWAVLRDEGVGVAVLVVATVGMWAMSTMRHVGLMGQPRLQHR
jgi:hypothetical protein